MWLYYFLAAVFGYLLGSVPTGYLVGRAHGIDVREHGSGNIGATNVVRVLGKKPGYFVFACDALKGFFAVEIVFFFLRRILPKTPQAIISLSEDSVLKHPPSLSTGSVLTSPPPGFETIYFHVTVGCIIGALACILGHNFPVWLKFRGGKGVATTIGTLLGLMPLAFLVVALVWIVAFFVSRYVSLASMLAAASLPLAVWIFGMFHVLAGGSTLPLLCFSVVAAVLVWWRHRGNIQRLLNGTEPRFTRKA